MEKQKHEMTVGAKVRRVAAPFVVSGSSYALSDTGEFDLARFLLWLGSSVGAGASIYWVIEYGEKLTRRAWNTDFKFYFAQVLSYALPVGAYLTTVGLGWQVWNVALLIAAVVVGYQTSQTLHFETTPAPSPEEAKPAIPATGMPIGG